MAVKTQGTEIYIVDNSGASPALLKFLCPTGVTGLGGGSTDEIDTTCLDATSKTYELGLSDNGDISVPFIFDPAAQSHKANFKLASAKKSTQCIVCLSDGATAPTMSSAGVITAPAQRTSFTFTGLIKGPAIDISGNEVVRGTMTVRVSGVVAVKFADGTASTLG